MINLKKCPFCGSDAAMINSRWRVFYVTCTGEYCGAQTSGVTGLGTDDELREKAAAPWNKRAYIAYIELI